MGDAVAAQNGTIQERESYNSEVFIAVGLSSRRTAAKAGRENHSTAAAPVRVQTITLIYSRLMPCRLVCPPLTCHFLQEAGVR